MFLKQLESMTKFFIKAAGIAYLAGLMSFLGTELHARETRGYVSDDAIRVPTSAPPYATRAQLDRLRALDTLMADGDTKQRLKELHAEVAALRETVEQLRFRPSHEATRDLGVRRVVAHGRHEAEGSDSNRSLDNIDPNVINALETRTDDLDRERDPD
jgi:hypothetical protein